MSSHQILVCGLFILLWPSCQYTPHQVKSLDYDLELITAHRINGRESLATGFVWTQARAATVQGESRYSLMTMSQKFSGGSDVYFDLYQSFTFDTGRTWTTPEVIPTLRIHDIEGGYRRSMSDMTPQWHATTGKVLNIGKSFFYFNEIRLGRSRRAVAYAVYDPQTKHWSTYKELELPQ